MADEQAEPQTATELDQADRSLAEAIVDRALNEAPPRERDPATGKFVGKESEAAPEGGAEDAAPEETQDSGEQDQGEGEPETVIDPPASWTAEAKEAFAKLPPELKQYVSERESVREKGVNSKLAELAEARKKIDPELSAVTQERQRLAALLEQVQQFQMMANPVISEGLKTDWVKLAREDPAGYTARKAEFDQQMLVMQAMHQEHQRLNQVNQQKAFTDYQQKVSQVFPDYADPVKGKAVVDKWAPILLENGFSQDEIAQTRSVMWDPRHLRMFDSLVDKAAKWDSHEKAAKSVALKKAAQPAQAVSRPKANGTSTKVQESAHVAALKKQAEKSGSDRDFARYLAAKHAEEKRT